VTEREYHIVVARTLIDVLDTTLSEMPVIPDVVGMTEIRAMYDTTRQWRERLYAENLITELGHG
jgi:hypothetical protein